MQLAKLHIRGMAAVGYTVFLGALGLSIRRIEAFLRAVQGEDTGEDHPLARKSAFYEQKLTFALQPIIEQLFLMSPPESDTR